MKVLCEEHNDLPKSTMIGWANALQKIGFEFIFWNPKRKPVFDAFDENQPDIFISTVKSVSRGMAQCLKESVDTKTLFYSPAYDLVPAEDLEYMEMLRQDTGKPDLIFSFCHRSRLYSTLGDWMRTYKTESIMQAADTFRFNKSKSDPLWGGHLTLVADYEPFMAPYIFPLKNKMRLFGDNWPISQGVGKPEDNNIPRILSSSDIVLDLKERTYEPSDTFFNTLISGNQCFSNTIEDVFPDAPIFHNPAELKTLLENTKVKSNNFQKIILEEHTYIHRMSELLNFIGFDDESELLKELL